MADTITALFAKLNSFPSQYAIMLHLGFCSKDRDIIMQEFNTSPNSRFGDNLLMACSEIKFRERQTDYIRAINRD
jgi:hypothetical protein